MIRKRDNASISSSVSASSSLLFKIKFSLYSQISP
nr:MAG TPA: hypothetical protein [Caudoviricetes sp.]